LAPEIPIIARGSNQEHVLHLCNLGVGRVVVAEMEGALEMVHQCLDQLGLSAPDTQTFVEEIRMEHYAALLPEQSALLPSMLRRILRHEHNELLPLNTGWVGQSLGAVADPSWTVLALVRPQGSLLRPGPEVLLVEGDQLLIQGPRGGEPLDP